MIVKTPGSQIRRWAPQQQQKKEERTWTRSSKKRTGVIVLGDSSLKIDEIDKLNLSIQASKSQIQDYIFKVSC